MRRLLMLSAFLAAMVAHARVIQVPADEPTVQAGIDAAADGDTVLLALGTYREAISFTGKAITVTGSDPADSATVANTVISSRGIPCHDRCSVVTFDAGEGPESVLDGLTIAGGGGNQVPGDHWSTAGGGIFCRGVAPTIRNCVIAENSVTNYGGGVYCENASPLLEQCRIAFNRVDAVHGEGRGEGVYCGAGSNLLMRDCRIEANEGSAVGGGIAIFEAEATLLDTEIRDNLGGNGAGVYALYSSGPVVLDHCTIHGNIGARQGRSAIGGGLYLYVGDATLRDCIISANQADMGGALYTFMYYDALQASHCTFTGNSTFHAEGAVDTDHSRRDAVHFDSCIFWGDAPREFELTGHSAKVTYSLVEGGHGGTGNLDADPRFCNVTCGVIEDLGLSEDSPCVGSGRGGTTMGATEVACVAPYRPAATVLEVPADYATIGAALAAACDRDTIRIAPGTYQEPNLTIPGSDLVLRGWDPDDPAVVAATVLDGRGRGTILSFLPGAPHQHPVVEGLTIANGGNHGISGNGASPWIRSCVIRDCSSPGDGGGIFFDYGGAPYIDRCTIRDNHSKYKGGGINGEYGVDLTVDHSIIIHNQTEGEHLAHGGGLRMTLANLRLINSIVAHNHATGGAGGVDLYGTDATIFNSTIADNRTGCPCGGGLSATEGGWVAITNSIVWGNAPDTFHSSYATIVARYCDITGGWEGSGNINSDPNFRDPEQDDYHLSMVRSPCIDTGTADGAPTDDFEGAPRPARKGYDIGADEAPPGRSRRKIEVE